MIPDNNQPQHERSFLWYLRKITEEFCNKTPLHGYKFIILKRASSKEKLFWSTISIAAVFIAIYLVYITCVTQYSGSLTETYCGSTNHLVNGFNFPSISICNLNKMSKRKVKRIVEEIINEAHLENDANTTNEVMNDLRYLSNLLYANYEERDDVIYRRLENYLKLLNKPPNVLLVNLSQSCDELLQTCSWKMKGIKCNTMFQPSITPEGVCCTANNFAFKNFTFEGYRADRYKYSPLISTTCGYKMGLHLVLNINPEDYFLSEFQSEGAKILLNDPYNYIEWGSQSVVVSTKRRSIIYIIPSGVDSDPSIFQLDPKNRDCVRDEERKIEIFSKYTHINCLNECRMRMIIENCSCIPVYYLNRYVILEDSRPCELADISCLSRMKEVFMSSVPGFNESTINITNHEWGEEKSPCGCVPNCDFDSYAIRKTEIHDVNTSVYISYRYLYGTLYVTQLTINWSSLFGVIGGLVSLTLGFTPIAGLTFIYYFIVKLCFYKKQDYDDQNEEIEVKNIRNVPSPSPKTITNKNYKNWKIQEVSLSHYNSYDKDYPLPYLD